MESLNTRIKDLERQVTLLTSKIADLMINTENKFKNPVTYAGGSRDRSLISPVDIKTGLGQIKGAPIVWHTEELKFVPYGTEPTDPSTQSLSEGLNKHTHSRYSGGALLIDYVEFVEYDFTVVPISNKHSQQYWTNQPPIKTVLNTDNETVQKIGKLDLIFNADSIKWGVAAYELDVRKCSFVMRDEAGNILTDGNGNEMSSPLYNSDVTKTSIVWDINSRVWRLYAVYSPDSSQV